MAAGIPAPTRRSGPRRALTAVLALTVAAGACRDEAPRARPRSAAELELPPDSRFGQIKALLSKDPESKVRAYTLYPLVDPVCRDPEIRARLVADAAAWVNVREEPQDRAWAAMKTIDTLEHVATSCFRNLPEGAYALLDAARKVIPDRYRFDVIEARLSAAAGDHPRALAASRRAREAGSVHALALEANVLAQQARASGPGYRPGMLDPALALVSAEPAPDWPLIDLTAVLSTRAHLLRERAIWEDGDSAVQTRRQARQTWRRLGGDPFIEVTRRHALDALCFDAGALGEDPERGCPRAAQEFQNLGAAAVAGLPVDRAPFDEARFVGLLGARSRLDALPEGAAVIVVARGDENELVAWARPAARVLARLAARHPRVFVVDRTDGDRAGALLDRILVLSGLPVVERIAARRDTLAMPCVAALVAGRQRPAACPLPDATVKALSARHRFGAAILIGRDLDAEISDLRLYSLWTLLLSVRLPLIDAGVDLQLKNLSDAWLLAPEAERLAGRLAPPTEPPPTDATR